jgi:signal transduction histidine kinase
LETAWALIWIAAQSALLTIVVIAHSPNSGGISSSIIFSVFQFFAFCTAYLTRKETKARDALLRSNAELKSTQLLLAHSSRIGERVRISRELHDVLGHDLTALSLHLEIARNTQDAQRDVEKAQLLAKGLLAKVREVVTLMRSDDEVRIIPILKGLVAEEPKLKVHLKADEEIGVLDSERAHTLLRCVQEAITNARVHSGANNLWLDIYRQGDCVVAQAKDDGRGTPSPASRNDGHGLMGIQERLKEFGGSMVVSSSPGEGFCLHVVLPLGYP